MSIKVFQITGIRGQELLDLRGKIAALAGQFCPDQRFVPECTHLIVPATAGLQTMTEKLCSCLAARKWVLTPDYISQSYERREWMDESGFERFIRTTSPTAGLPDPASEKLFSTWIVLLYMSDRREKCMYQRSVSHCLIVLLTTVPDRILKAGGAQLALDRSLRDESDCISLRPITHVVYYGMDPFSPELRHMLDSHVQVICTGGIAQLVQFQFSAAAGDSSVDSGLALEISACYSEPSDLSSALVTAAEHHNLRPSLIPVSSYASTSTAEVAGNESGDVGTKSSPIGVDHVPAVCPVPEKETDADGDTEKREQDRSDESVDDDDDDNWSTCSETECDDERDGETESATHSAPFSSSANDSIGQLSVSQAAELDMSYFILETASFACAQSEIRPAAGGELTTAPVQGQMIKCEVVADKAGSETNEQDDQQPGSGDRRIVWQSDTMQILDSSHEAAGADHRSASDSCQATGSDGNIAAPGMQSSDQSESSALAIETEIENDDCGKRKVSEVNDTDAENQVKKIKSESEDRESDTSQQLVETNERPELPPDVQPIVDAFCGIRIPDYLLHV